METVDELCQDTQKFHNYQRNSARQQQQKDAYLQKRASNILLGWRQMGCVVKKSIFLIPSLMCTCMRNLIFKFLIDY